MNQRRTCPGTRHSLVGLLIHVLPWTCVCTLCLTQVSLSQTPSLPVNSLRVTFIGALPDTVIRLPHRFIAPGTDTLFVLSYGALKQDLDYHLSHGSGIVHLDSLMLARLRELTARDTLGIIVTYRYVPLEVQDVYRLRTLVVPADSVSKAGGIREIQPAGTFSMDDIFGPGLQKSGSIVRGFTVGSNRDLSLNSGLRLQMSGRQ